MSMQLSTHQHAALYSAQLGYCMLEVPHAQAWCSASDLTYLHSHSMDELRQVHTSALHSCTVQILSQSRPSLLMQVSADNPQFAASAVQRAEHLFHQLALLWPSDQEPLLHAQVLLLHAQLAGLLALDKDPLQLAQDALHLVQAQVLNQRNCL